VGKDSGHGETLAAAQDLGGGPQQARERRVDTSRLIYGRQV
jgi:hypothetical protein